MSLSGNPLSASGFDRRQRARDALAKLREQAEAGELPDVPLPPREPPPAVTPAEPTAPAFDLAKSDPDGWARYQREVAGDKDKEIAAERAATLAVLPPLRSGQNMYYLYDENGDVVKKYTPSQARRLPPDEAAQLEAVTEKDGGLVRFYHFGQDVGDEALDYLKGGGPEHKGEKKKTPIADAGDAIAEGAEGVVDAVGGVFSGGAGVVKDLAQLVDWLAKYAPYLLMIGAAGTVVYIAAPLVSAARSASSGRRRRSSRPE